MITKVYNSNIRMFSQEKMSFISILPIAYCRLSIIFSTYLHIQGDSGGPLVCPDSNGKGKLAGLVSFGYTGCTSAGVYTKAVNNLPTEIC